METDIYYTFIVGYVWDKIVELHFTMPPSMYSQVGSVEQFQGKEFNMILVSTVRSNPKLTAHNQQFTLGFVNNGKVRNITQSQYMRFLSDTHNILYHCM